MTNGAGGEDTVLIRLRARCPRATDELAFSRSLRGHIVARDGTALCDGSLALHDERALLHSGAFSERVLDRPRSMCQRCVGLVGQGPALALILSTLERIDR